MCSAPYAAFGLTAPLMLIFGCAWATVTNRLMDVLVRHGAPVVAAAPTKTQTMSLAVPVAVMPAEQTVVLPSTHQSFNLELPLREARDAFEKAYFEYHLAQESGSMTRVADKTGLERTHLYRKLKQLGLDLSKTKKSALA